MISAWVLVIFMSSGTGKAGGPAIIDNIVSRDECVRVSEIVAKSTRTDEVRCIEVRKVKGAV